MSTYEIASDEILVVEFGTANVGEDGKVLGKGDQAAEEETNAGANKTERRNVGELVIRDALGAACADEENMRHQEGDPGQQTEDSDQVDKVAENNLGVLGSVHEGGAAEEGRDGESGDGNTAPVSPAEDPGGMTLLGKTVNGTGGNVKIRVGSRESEEQDAGVEETRKMPDVGELDGNDERRGRGFGSSFVGKTKLLGVVGNNHAQEEDGKAVEEQDSVEGELDGARNRLAWVLSLTDSDTDEFGTKVGKDGVDQRAPEAVELAGVAFGNVWLERTGLVVVLEAGCLARADTDREEEGEDDNADNGNDLDRAEPEFEFSKEFDAEVIDGHNDDKEDGNPHARIHLGCGYPLLDDQCRSRELVGCGNNVFHPVGPSEGKTKSRVAEPGSITSEARGVGNPCSHFAESRHDNVDQHTDRGVGNEN